jgi:choline dehydrogenase-like flavoprotein
MIIELDHLPAGANLAADVAIVGAGAAGLVIAREFLGSAAQVVLIESGGWTAHDETQELCAGEIVGQPFRGLQAGRARAFGGTTTQWGGQCLPFDPIDFEERPWVDDSGWPISAADIAPYYERAYQRLGIGPEEYRGSIWERFGLDPIPLDGSRLASLHSVFIRQPNFAQRYRAELGRASNVRVVLHANVTRLETDASGSRIEGVTFRSLGGREGRVDARYVILCGGGIENARLLLLSAQPHTHGPHANGLGNGHDVVGRFLQDHPCGRTAEIVTNNPRLLQDHWNMLYSRRAYFLPKLGLSEAAQRREQVLNCVGRLEYEYEPESGMQAARDLFLDLHARRWPSDLVRKMLTLGRAAPELAMTGLRLATRGLSPAIRPRHVYLETFTEQTPNRNSRVTLSDERDALGLRRVKVDWQLDDLTWKTLRVFTRLVGEEFARLGLGEVRPVDWLEMKPPPADAVIDSYHPTGATRMARHPREGVVDADCEVFGVRGLYIAGSSVFPTSGAANPTFTLIALALRLADHLKADLADLARPAMPPRSRAVVVNELAVADGV